MSYDKLGNIPNERIEKIHNALVGDNVTAAQFAIRDCVLYGLNDEICVTALKKLKMDNTIKIVKISDLALAALDLLGIEKYTGESELIKELIKTNFYTDKKM